MLLSFNDLLFCDFHPREAHMETAELPEPLDSVHGWISIFHKSSLLKIVGPAARH